jgi:hypothetical protein
MLRGVSPARLDHPGIDAVLSTAAQLLDMEVVFLGGLSDEQFSALPPQVSIAYSLITDWVREA